MLVFGLSAAPITSLGRASQAHADPNDATSAPSTSEPSQALAKAGETDENTEPDGENNLPAAPDGDIEPNEPSKPAIVATSDDDLSSGPAVRGPAEWAIDKLLDIGFDLVATAALDSLGNAADASGNEDLVKVVDFVDGILGGSASIEHECDKILGAVNELSLQITDLENHIDAQFLELERTITLNQIEEQRKQIIQMSISVYAPALTAYTAYIQASKDYSDAIGTTNEAHRLQDAQTKERALVKAFDDLNYRNDLTTVENYGVNMGSYTNHRYLYYLNQYADETLAFDHQRFALLTAGINDVATNLGVITYVERLEYDYWAAKAASDPNDVALQQKVLDLENELTTNLDRVVRDINYVSSEYANKDNAADWPRTDLLTLMRPYDFETSYSFSYQPSSSRSFDYYHWDDHYGYQTRTWHYTAEAKKTTQTMKAYRASVGGQVYLVVDGDVGLTYGSRTGDVIHGMRYWEKISEGFLPISNEYVGFPDQDFYNLQSTADGVYKMPKDFSPLAPIVQGNSYKSSGGSLVGHLAKNGMSSLGSEAYVVMNSYVEPMYPTGAIRQNHYTTFYWYSTLIPTSGDYSNSKASLTAEDTAPDSRLLAVLAQEPNKREAHPLHLVTEGSGLALAATDLSGNALPANVPAGTRVKLTVTAADTAALDALVLKSADGDVLETFASADTANLVTGGTNNAVFTFTMPYQEASLVGTPGKAEPNPLHFAQDADGAYLVSTLDDLVKVSAAYDQHAGMYRGATFRLADDIVNVRFPFPVWSTPIGTEDHPFAGTFDGAGHAIGGFTMNMETGPLATQKFGGIFGVIDASAVVHDVAVYAMDYRGNDANHTIGGLAGANYGIIDNCSTGSAQTGITVDPSLTDLTFLDPSYLPLINVTITGYDAGGLVAYNRGQVINSWSGADVSASANGGHGGGLVGYSDSGSTVWNSYAMGRVRSGHSVGGLIARSYADVHNTYYCGSEVTGSIRGSFIGENHHDVFSSFVRKDVVSKPFGTGYQGDSPDASLTVMENEAMASFLLEQALNKEVVGNMNFWTWNAEENNGYPYQLKDPMIQRTVTDEATGVTLTGTMHAAAQLAIAPLSESDVERQTLYRHALDNGLLGAMTASYNAFLPVVAKKSGQSPLEGTVTLSFPLAEGQRGGTVKVLQQHVDGVTTLDALVKDGRAYVEIDALTPFAVVTSTNDAAPSVPAGNPASLAPTGDAIDPYTPMVAAVAAIAALGCAMTFVSRASARARRQADTTDE
ncbi:hypothetical protein C1878_09510 [Gordonibacter sp. 28C]|uniref:hypothetical protein n=1 Tax=Gordonibacter sp. 28C TaxID=2078569 RepID=UPI000DF799EE|nr:hypothetical protein [Gordonibacter sp. 28C]RDB62035.1 hypothetical protein C1878_09510 [Gordonibacter sp. 28C]